MKKRFFSILTAVVILLTMFMFNSPASFAAAESMFASKTGTGYYDNAAYELGTIFRSSTAGQITAVKAYGVTGETGSHTVRIWRNSDNTVVAGPYTWSYTGNNSWQTYTLPTPLNIAAGTDYTVTVSTGVDTRKYYAAVNGDFTSGGNNGASLSWPANAGVYTTSLGTRPTSTWSGSNYLRDVVFNTTAPGTPDLVVTDISWSPANPAVGSEVTFSATIKNQGTAATPAGVIHGVLFFVDGVPAAWSDNSTASLAVGATRVLTANGGPSKATWTATSGTHTVLANVDDVNRIAESDENNNTRSKSLTVGGTQPTPLIFEQFNPWEGTTSPDGVWRKAGPWTGGFNNLFDSARAVTQSTYNGQDGGWLLLNSLANSYNGSEIQTLPSYGYGYYEVRMKPTGVSGVCNSFFWIESTSGYGPCEWDVEFFTNTGSTVHFTIHPTGRSETVNLPFNPANDFHRYGFLWTPGRIDFTIDGAVSKSFTDSSLDTDVKGYIMMNNWTTTGWLGGPPAQNTTAVYDWVKFYPGATEVIP